MNISGSVGFSRVLFWYVKAGNRNRDQMAGIRDRGTKGHGEKSRQPSALSRQLMSARDRGGDVDEGLLFGSALLKWLR
jgi:hypothetical protein